ncbi:MAG: multisubunit Na+/H+ antiporter MnhB subunit [Flavobacteriales bacterium]|jgi:multisubunit Na+/H+ antiporter MnhB subunit
MKSKKMSKEKIVGAALIIIGLVLNFSTIEFPGVGFIAGAVCAMGIGLLFFNFKVFK